MLRLCVIFLIIALTYCRVSASTLLETRLYARSWKLPTEGPRKLVQGTLFTNNVHTFPYATCEFTKPNVERMCNITLVDPNKPTDSGICRFKIFAGEGKELFYNGYFQMIPFAQDHVAVGWYSQTKEPKDMKEKKYFFRISILNMSSCKTSDRLDFPIQKVNYGFFPSLVTYDKQIDVIVNSKKACDDIDKCKLSFDLNGKQIGNVQPYKPKYSQYGSAASPITPTMGFYQIVKDLSSIRVIFVNATGDGTEVLNVHYDEQKQFKRDAYSDTYGFFTLCWTPTISTKNPTKINCSQFDSTGGNVTAKVSKEITYPQLLDWTAVQNLPQGGFLLATGGCEKVESEKCKTFHVRRISERGQETSYEFRAPDLQCHDITSNLEVRISENGDEICFDFACLSSPSRLDYVSKCVDKVQLH